MLHLLVGVVIGAVIVVVVPKAYAWVKSKIVTPVETKVAAVETEVKKEV